MGFNIGSFFRKSVRVWRVMKKPSKDELMLVVKASAIGILIIGLIGFLISTLMRFFPV